LNRPGKIWTMLRNVLLMVLLIAGIGWGVAGFKAGSIAADESAVLRGLWQKAAGISWKNVLNSGMPVMKRMDPEEAAGAETGKGLMGHLLFYLTGVRVNNPVNLLRNEIPMLAAVMPVTAMDTLEEYMEADEATEPPGEDSPTDEPPPTVANKVYSGETLIALYNTHSSETYELTDGLTHLKGKAGGITKVAAEMARFLQETYRLKPVWVDKLHDTAFGKAYVESEKTVKELLRQNPKLQMVVDIHRDGFLPKERTTVKIGGQDMAKILLVVGTDARAAHPNWRKNLEFARLVAAKMDQLYPGLSRGIAIKDGRYNQQHHPRALLVEIGSAKNSTDEAVRAARLFANVLVAVLNDLE